MTTHYNKNYMNLSLQGKPSSTYTISLTRKAEDSPIFRIERR
jgi:hypothetical protein